MDAATYRARVAVREVAAYMEFAERAQAPAGFWERGGRWTVYEHPPRAITSESVTADMSALRQLAAEVEPDPIRRRHICRLPP